VGAVVTMAAHLPVVGVGEAVRALGLLVPWLTSYNKRGGL
jgi:hypothetical protein